MKSIYNVAIDCGNFNFNTDAGIMFNSMFCVDDGASPLDEPRIIIDGVTYLIGKGERDLTYNKTEKQYIQSLIYAIDRNLEETGEIKSDNQVNLCIGCPLDNTGLKEKFISELVGKTFTYKIGTTDSKERTIKIVNLLVIGEGISSFYSLGKSAREKSTVIFDIGGLSVNICSFVNGRLEHHFTLPKGMLNVQEEIRLRINSNGNNQELKDIERLINDNLIDGVEEEYKKFVNEFMNFAKIKIKIDNYSELLFTGGGSIRLKNGIKNSVVRAKFFDDPLFSNVKGNRKLLNSKKWSD